MAKWVAAFILLMFATGSSFPIYFTDQVFRSLDQLDEALANGEISQEYYDQIVDVFATDFDDGLRFKDSTSDIVPTQGEQVSYPEWKFGTSYHQKLERNYAPARFDLVSLRTYYYRGALIMEKKDGKPELIRALTVTIRRSGLRIDVGGLAPQYASGLTVGRGELHRELHSSNAFASSILFPTQHLKNGIAFTRDFSRSNASAFVSRIEGNRFYCQSVGGDFEVTEGWADFGLAALHQQVGQFGDKSRKQLFLAPHFRKQRFGRSFSTESSFQIGGASAHLLQYEFRSRRLLQSIILFAYGSKYQNLESGGYAYSDYDDATIDEVGMEYREKRAGRRGIAIEQSFRFHPETLSAQLVRWQNRLDDRQCVAARLTFEQTDRFPVLSRLRFQAIYQNLDIEHGTDTRKLIALSTELNPSSSFIYENQHKIEQRVLDRTKKYPFRSRHDFTLKINPDLESIAMINFYDSDLNTSGNSQLTLAIGEALTISRDFRFSARLQTRYKFSTEQLDNWELRLNLQVVL